MLTKGYPLKEKNGLLFFAWVVYHYDEVYNFWSVYSEEEEYEDALQSYNYHREGGTLCMLVEVYT